MTDHWEALDRHYEGIWQQGRGALLRGGVWDPHLRAPAGDDRMSLALVIRPSPAVAGGVENYLERLRQGEPTLYCYPREDLHLTVLDILHGVSGRTVPQEISAYLRCIRDCAAQSAPFSIHFRGTIASDSAVLIRGYCGPELEALRTRLRSALPAAGLSLEERYQTISAHITAARLAGPLRDPTAFLARLRTETNFGLCPVSALELVFHNWYDAKKEVLARFDLGQRPQM